MSGAHVIALFGLRFLLHRLCIGVTLCPMDILWIIFLFLLGACVGSFLNVVIYRMPRGESIAFPGSHCPACGRGIAWYDNIPLLSWLVLRGRCRFCKAAISPRYILIEAATALLVAGLYVCYYVLPVRSGAGHFADTWPMFAAHALLVCGLLACSAVDIEHWIVPLEVCWFLSLAGLLSAAAAPHPWMPTVSPALGAGGVGAALGLPLAMLLMRYGIIQPSFMDAQDAPAIKEPPKAEKPNGKKHSPKQPITAVAYSKQHGVNPRREILREALFLLPAILLAVAAHLAVTHVGALNAAWAKLTSPSVSPAAAPHVNGFLAAMGGYLVGGLWVWGMRIFGTLAFGKEAMGMGDVHLMAAVGAVTGWIVPSVAFFVAPFFGLLWAVYLWLGRNQRELPYGPWLSAATLMVMVCYDAFASFLRPYAQAIKHLLP